MSLKHTHTHKHTQPTTNRLHTALVKTARSYHIQDKKNKKKSISIAATASLHRISLKF